MTRAIQRTTMLPSAYAPDAHAEERSLPRRVAKASPRSVAQKRNRRASLFLENACAAKQVSVKKPEKIDIVRSP